jgi:hypothetical protein
VASPGTVGCTLLPELDRSGRRAHWTCSLLQARDRQGSAESTTGARKGFCQTAHDSETHESAATVKC